MTELMTDLMKMTDLIKAVREHNIDEVKRLIDAGVNVNERDEYYSTTALMHAIVCDCQKIVELLLEKGADIHVQSLNFNIPSAIRLAFINGNIGIIKLLETKLKEETK